MSAILQKLYCCLLSQRLKTKRGVRMNNISETNEDIQQGLKKIGSVLSHGPSLFLDNGADLTKMAVRDSRFSIKDVLGGTEETTSGARRNQ